MTKYLSDKASGHHSTHHNYTKLYHELFSQRRNETLNILEIGIGSMSSNIPSNMTGGPLGRIYMPGASIRGWNEYFPNANIYACDIDTKILHFDEPRITGFYLDQTDTTNIEYIINEGALKDVKLDIIIDDGLHFFPTNCSVMNILLPKVRTGGIYIIEDILHSQYNYKHLNFDLLNGKEYQYVRFPNPHNNGDNNLFIVKC